MRIAFLYIWILFLLSSAIRWPTSHELQSYFFVHIPVVLFGMTEEAVKHRKKINNYELEIRSCWF